MAVTAGVILAGIPACAGNASELTPFDATLSYSARHSETNSDNDIARLTLGAAWGVLDGAMRGAVDLGVRNENFAGSYSEVLGGELVFARDIGDARYGLGGQAGYAKDRGTALSLGVSAEHFGERFDTHGLLGGAYLDSPEKTKGASQTLGYLQGDASWYVTSNWAVTGGALATTDGSLWGVGTEFVPPTWRVSLFFEWGHAFSTFRGIDRYNDLTVGIRYIPHRYTLQSYRRNNLARMMALFVEPQ